MVPNDWEKVSFGHLAKFNNGVSFTETDQGEAIKIAGVSDFREQPAITNLDGFSVVKVGNKLKERDLIQNGDLLFIRSNGNKELVGKCILFAKVTEKLSFSASTIRGRVTSDKVLPSYMALLSRSNIVKQQFLRNRVGTNASNLNQQVLNDVVIPLPAIAEQYQIIKILSAWDRAISTTKKLIELSKKQKKILMQQLLTAQKRLLDPSTGRAFTEKWQRLSISDLAFVDRKFLGKNTASDFKFEYISLSDVNVGLISEKLETHLFSSSPSRARRVLQEDDILLAKIRPNLQSFAKITSKHSDKIASTGFAVLTPKEQVSSDYLYQYLFSNHITDQLVRLVEGAKYPIVNSTDVAGLKLYCPTFKEQQKIVSVLTTADKEITLLQSKLSYFKQERNILMHQLLSGKCRVEVKNFTP